MNITVRTEYGWKTLMDIAFHEKHGVVQRRHIAVRQSIPTDYMDQLLNKLRAAGLIHSFRGREGGYHLAKDPESITILDVVEAVEEPSHIGDHLEKLGGDIAYATEYLTEPAIDFIKGTIKRQLKKYTLAMFLEEANDRMQEAGLDPFEVIENKPTKDMLLQARRIIPIANNIRPQDAFVH